MSISQKNKFLAQGGVFIAYAGLTADLVEAYEALDTG